MSDDKGTARRSAFVDRMKLCHPPWEGPWYGGIEPPGTNAFEDTNVFSVQVTFEVRNFLLDIRALWMRVSF